MNRFLALASATVFCLMLSAPARAEEPQPEGAALLTSAHTLGPVHIRERYISMTGPIMRGSATLLGTKGQEGPLWVKGFKVDVLDDKGQKESSEYLCHSWVTLGAADAADQKMLTISEGLDAMTFPQGFAVRVESAPGNAALLAQALNNNEETDKNLSYKLTVSYLDDAAARKYNIRNLRTVSVAVMAKDANPEGSSEICTTQDEAASVSMAVNAGGGTAKSVVHFDVPPGRHEYRSAIPKQNPMLLGGTIHYIKLHLHPYGESIALIDKTSGATLWKGEAKMVEGRALLTDVDYYSSAKGIRIDPAHEYEISTVYNNTTDRITDAMAVLRLYIADDDKEGTKP